MTLVLSLFPGIGLLDRAFEAEGFTVVRGPDVLWGGDIREFHPPAGKFDGVVGGPPCQTFSSLARLVRANGHEPRFGNLIPEFERCVVEAQPAWFVMENVPQAPVPIVAGYGIHSFELDNSMLDSGDGHGHEQRRVRRFSFGVRGAVAPNLMRWIDLAVFVLPDAERHPSVVSQAIGIKSDGYQYSAEGRERRDADRRRTTAVTAGHSDANVSLTQARRERKRTVTALGPDHLDRLRESTNEVKRVRAATVQGGGTFTSGAQLRRDGKRSGDTSRASRLITACRLQGLPEDFLSDAPFTADGKLKAVANGVPLFMGGAIAKAVREAIGLASRISPGAEGRGTK